MARPTTCLGCVVSGCKGKHYAKGLCNKHYKSAWWSTKYASDKKAINARVRAWEKKNADKVKERKAASYARNKEKQLALQAQRRAENPDKYKARVKASEKRHPDRAAARHRAYKQTPKSKESARLYSARVRRERPELKRRYEARRKALLLNATPAWANEFFIEGIYDLAQRRTKVMGFPWHVDHIVPLKSKIVCGLHCEQNMQVIPGEENIRKNNRYWPDMPTD